MTKYWPKPEVLLVSGGEIYTNLERGVIDATEWIGSYHDYIIGFHNVVKYYYYPSWHESFSKFKKQVSVWADTSEKVFYETM